MKGKFYITTNQSSGISSNTIEEALDYIREELERVIEENPNEMIDIEINSYEEEDYEEDYEDEEETFNMTEEEVRADWETALKQVNRGTDLSSVIDYGFTKNDIVELAKLHKTNKFREKIEDLLTDCNFHYECGQFMIGEYEEFLKEEK